MRAEINASALDAALKAGVAVTKGPLPILGYALLEAAGDAVSVTTYSVAMRARTRVPAVVAEAGRLCANAAALRAAAMGGGELEIKRDQVKRARSRFKVDMLDPKDFPGGDTIRWAAAGITVEQLRAGLDSVAFACNRSDIRPYCRCVVLMDGLCAGTDGHRLALFDVEYLGHTLLIPIESVPFLRRRLGDGAAVEIGYATDGTAAFIAAGTDDDRIEVALERSNYSPDLRVAVPLADPDASITMPRDYLLAEITRLAPFCSTRFGPHARLAIRDGLVIESIEGDSRCELTGEVTGSTEMGLNLDYLADAIGVRKDESVRIEFHGGRSAVLRDEAFGLVQVISGIREVSR